MAATLPACDSKSGLMASKVEASGSQTARYRRASVALMTRRTATRLPNAFPSVTVRERATVLPVLSSTT